MSKKIDSKWNRSRSKVSTAQAPRSQRQIFAQPLQAEAFDAFGQVIEAGTHPDMVINRGNCARFHDLADLDFSDGRPGISVFSAKPCRLPLRLSMMERHPLGSQAFIPFHAHAFLVVVASDEGGIPGIPRAFLTNGNQGVNYARSTWHGVLTPLAGDGLFAVVDRIGAGVNLQEHWFEQDYLVNC
jgi:ureidoglycolate lyase